MLIQYLATDQRYFMAVVVTVVISICLHELAHGIVAVWLGDRTPIETGHMTLNPAVHMGVFSVICLFIAGIAWGAMPVDTKRLRGSFAPAAVAFAGPLTNVLLSAAALGGLGLWQRYDFRATVELPIQLQNLTYFLWVFGVTNIHLAIFNMIPVPPLDGSRILANFSPSYEEMIRLLTVSGGAMMFFVMVFSAVGKFTAPAAVSAAQLMLDTARGFH